MSDCILYAGALNWKGYGRKWRGRKTCAAHRLAWEDAFGAIPEGLCVLHKCDVPNCINPEHLFLGTLGDNNRDRAAKGRSAIAERHGLAKLSAGDIPLIRALLADRKVSVSEIGRRFGVNERAIRDVRDGKTWKHVSALHSEPSP